MNFDELKECTRCNSNACYKQEVTKDISIELCYGCGFQSNSIMVKGSDFFNEQLELLPELYKILMDEEEDTGKITILDKRVITKRYGKSLIDALPPFALNVEK